MPRAHLASHATSPRRSTLSALRDASLDSAGISSLPLSLILLISVLALVGAAGPAAADDVYLRNGQIFEGVIAERTADSVRIRLEFGEIRLAADQVLRIEKESSAVHEFLERKQILLSLTASSAARDVMANEWLSLADWARSRELMHGEREALLQAGQLDPRRSELAPRLRSLGLEFDERTERWIPLDEHMRSRGFVRVGEEWITRVELAQLQEQHRQAAAERRAAADSRALRDATVLLFAEAEATRQEVRAQRQSAPTVIVSTGGTVGFTTSPGFFIPPGYDGNSWSGTPVPENQSRQGRSGYEVLIGRPPGSLLPNSSSFTPAPRSRGTSSRGTGRSRSASGSSGSSGRSGGRP